MDGSRVNKAPTLAALVQSFGFHRAPEREQTVSPSIRPKPWTLDTKYPSSLILNGDLVPYVCNNQRG